MVTGEILASLLVGHSFPRFRIVAAMATAQIPFLESYEVLYVKAL